MNKISKYLVVAPAGLAHVVDARAARGVLLLVTAVLCVIVSPDRSPGVCFIHV